METWILLRNTCRSIPMHSFPLAKRLFDGEEEKAARILWSILETQSPRKSDRSQVFSESSEGANYRTIDRALTKLDAKMALMRLYDPESPFVLVDPTEIERKQAKSTEYVGRLSDGKTLGFWMIVFAQPYRGRAIPFHFGTYSEATIAEEATSRNLSWRSLVWEIKELVGEETPLVWGAPIPPDNSVSQLPWRLDVELHPNQGGEIAQAEER